jgi:hypothetical protein
LVEIQKVSSAPSVTNPVLVRSIYFHGMRAWFPGPKAANQPASENSVSLTCPLKAGQTNGKATTQPQKVSSAPSVTNPVLVRSIYFHGMRAWFPGLSQKRTSTGFVTDGADETF